MKPLEHKQNPHPYWPQVKKLATRLDVWVVALILTIVAVFHYVQIEEGHPLNKILRFLPAPLSRHSVERVVLVFPPIYASIAFGLRGGLLVLAIALIIMLPRALFISPHPVDATLETAMVMVVAGLLMWMTEEQERQRRLRERTVAEMELLNLIYAAAVESLELQEILERCLKTIANVMGADIAWVYLLDPSSTHLHLAGQYGLPEELKAVPHRLAVGEGLNGWVVQIGQPLALHDVSTDPRLLSEVFSGSEMRGFLAVPLKSKGIILGTIGVGAYVAHKFSPDQCHLLTTIAGQIAVMVEARRHCQQTAGHDG